MNHDSNIHSVCMAVLPFENHSGNPDHDYLSSGFMEDIVTDLSRFHSLQVISSYTSRKMGAEARNTLVLAKKFSIDYMLKGNLRRKGEHLRINTQLLETENGRILWAERYDAPMDTIFEIQDDIVERVSGAISTEIDKALLAASRKKPLTSLAAYDCWLRGMDQLRRGSPQADREARQTFQQALSLDPHYSRAYAGLSLSYFNEWSCQLWEHWDENERNAYRYAKQAIGLDDADHVTQLILGRILLYRRQFDLAEQHIEQSLALNANDADNLIQIATCKAFLGKADTGEELFRKALRLNPYRNIWYFTGGALIYFVQRKYKACIETALKGPLTDVWIDLPAIIAAACAHMGKLTEAARYLHIFKKVFHKKIITDRQPGPEEIIAWEKMANPYKHEADMANLIEGLRTAGLRTGADTMDDAPILAVGMPPMQNNTFKNTNGLWQITYAGTTVQLPEVKGFHDLTRLLNTPGAEVHCTQMMGNPDTMSEDAQVMDAKAIRSYKERIRDLRDAIQEAEAMNDLGRSEKLNAELDQLTEHIASAMGVGRRARRLNSPAERARAAVTWRIRSAIKKIEAAHPDLGHHLANSVRTGIFCCYDPERDQTWLL